MNKLYCLLLAFVLVAPLSVRAQQADSLRQALDHFFAPLDKSQVPTRLLADYAVPWPASPPSMAPWPTAPAPRPCSFAPSTLPPPRPASKETTCYSRLHKDTSN